MTAPRRRDDRREACRCACRRRWRWLRAVDALLSVLTLALTLWTTL